MNEQTQSMIVVLLASAVGLGFIFALIYWATSKFVIGTKVPFGRCLLAGLVGTPISLGLSAMLAFWLQSAGLYSGALAFAPAIPWFLVASGINAVVMRDANGARISFGQACRIQIAPMVIVTALSFMTRPPGY